MVGSLTAAAAALDQLTASAPASQTRAASIDAGGWQTSEALDLGSRSPQSTAPR